MAPVWSIVVAAGSGERFGGPKQYAPLGSRRVVDWSIGVARRVSDGVVLVVPSARVADSEPVDAVVAGGDTRSQSVRCGLAAVPDEAAIIIVHDAARPLASDKLWHAVVDAVRNGADAAVPVVPVADSLREVGAGPVDRARFVAVQTPQAFRAVALRAAHAEEPEATDDAALIDAAGGFVVTVDGEAANRKITTPDDVEMLGVLLS
jgi:2-C-methyl-D-erythritol 4-phosphate cytidylyltransferase